ncbi:hypothetical protein M9H77_02714 [Catharanthus roseus]|uniref:Uncharacterized protein n=1 Tax=Catharanthus roseus TaxID=4058 RepID=A0ACC0C979_CATRO|nr:hypothetical protein M9H77_02714 [Catharanthus roseus]
MALILLPVCRDIINWFRSKTKLGVAVPFHDNLNFHKMTAIAIALSVGIHGISHLVCDCPRLLSITPEEYELMIQYFGTQGYELLDFCRKSGRSNWDCNGGTNGNSLHSCNPLV